MMYLGDYLDNATVYFPFTTNAADGGRESFSAALEEADIVVLKNGVAMTLSASTITISLDLGGRTGVHTVAVDMNNDTDFTTGADYAAVLYASDETLDSQAPAGVLACWSCENRTSRANLIQIGGDAQSATDLKDFADAGYDPSTNKVQGVVLVDTTTTNTDMRGTDNAATAANLATHDGKLDTLTTTVGAAGAGLTEAGGDGDHLTAINLPNQTMDITGNLSGSVGSVTGAINTAAGTITTLDALNTAQNSQHSTTQTAIADVPTNAELATALDPLPTAAENAAAILAAGDVDGYSLEETLKLCLAALAGKLSGAATTTVAIRAADDSKARITATVDADGNRSAITLDETG